MRLILVIKIDIVELDSEMNRKLEKEQKRDLVKILVAAYNS